MVLKGIDRYNYELQTTCTMYTWYIYIYRYLNQYILLDNFSICVLNILNKFDLRRNIANNVMVNLLDTLK